MPLPRYDAPTLRSEAAEIDSALKRDAEQWARLAPLKANMKTARAELEQQAEMDAARRGAFGNETLFGLQGWAPGEEADTLAHRLSRSGIDRREVDRIFMTGGSSFVPAVRRIFVERFGEERIRSGGELTSVANGLALRAGQRSGADVG